MIYRSEAGKDTKRLDLAIDPLRNAYNIFKDLGNLRYHAIAAYYLGAAHFMKGDLAEARRFAEQFATGRPEDPRWGSNAKTLLSRIAREDDKLNEAKPLAEEALKIAKASSHRDCVVDALVALGEIELRLANRAAAQKLFEEALEDSVLMLNPKWTGACHLHLAATSIAEQNIDDAKIHLAVWESLAPHIENGFLHAFSEPQRSPQNRPMVVTSKPANEKAVRTSDSMTPQWSFLQGRIRYFPGHATYALDEASMA